MRSLHLENIMMHRHEQKINLLKKKLLSIANLQKTTLLKVFFKRPLYCHLMEKRVINRGKLLRERLLRSYFLFKSILMILKIMLDNLNMKIKEKTLENIKKLSIHSMNSFLWKNYQIYLSKNTIE